MGVEMGVNVGVNMGLKMGVDVEEDMEENVEEEDHDHNLTLIMTRGIPAHSPCESSKSVYKNTYYTHNTE